MKTYRLLLALVLLATPLIPAFPAHPLKAYNMNRHGIATANYSGITRISGNHYAIVSDTEIPDGFYDFYILLDPQTGRVIKVERGAFHANPNPVKNSNGSLFRRDTEGVAYCPKRNTVFISGEADQRIIEYDTLGVPTGHELDIPEWCSSESIVYNRGFEALAYSPEKARFYTMTESPLKADGPIVCSATPHAPQLLRLLSFSDSLTLCSQKVYAMNPATTTRFKHYYTYGVSAMTALPDGRLLVLEREINIPRRAWSGSVRHRIYIADPTTGSELPSNAPTSALQPKEYVSKRLLTEFTTRLNLLHTKLGNYEGLCLGPRLSDGSYTILLINDSQAGAGNSLYRLKDFLKVFVFSDNELQ